jgi:hypothetical protein
MTLWVRMVPTLIGSNFFPHFDDFVSDPAVKRDQLLVQNVRSSSPRNGNEQMGWIRPAARLESEGGCPAKVKCCTNLASLR